MKTNVFLSFLLALALGSCQSSSKVSTSDHTADSLTAIGGNKDKHGCLTSAGYTWSQLKNDCIRPFEDGIPLHTLNTSTSYQTAAYALIDSLKKEAEIFVPQEQSSLLLKLDSSNVYTNGKFILEQDDHCWTLSLNSTQLYQERK